ncbi:hypothetical protein HDU80_001703, partial [Chytriomyces hyalinus]
KMDSNPDSKFDNIWEVVSRDIRELEPLTEQDIWDNVKSAFTNASYFEGDKIEGGEDVKNYVTKMTSENKMGSLTWERKDIEVNMNLWPYVAFGYPDIKDIQVFVNELDQTFSTIGKELEDSHERQVDRDQCLSWITVMCRKMMEFDNKDMTHKDTKFYTIKWFRRPVAVLFESLRSNLVAAVTQSLIAKEAQRVKKEKEFKRNLKKELREQFKAVDVGQQARKQIVKALASVFSRDVEVVKGLLLEALSDWSTSTVATETAFERSFGLLNMDNMKSYLDSPVTFIQECFDSDFGTATMTTIPNHLMTLNSKLSDLISKTEDAVEAWFDNETAIASSATKRKEPLKLSGLFDAVSKCLRESVGIDNKARESAPTGRTIGELLYDSPLADLTVFKKAFEFSEKDVDLRNFPLFILHLTSSSSGTSKYFVDFQATKNQLDNFLAKKKKTMRIEAVGCRKCCPLCGAKCKYGVDKNGEPTHGHHEPVAHLIPSMGKTVQDSDGNFSTAYEICHQVTRIRNKTTPGMPRDEYLMLHHPSWCPFPTTAATEQEDRDEKIHQAWMKLRGWCGERIRAIERYNGYQDTTPDDWKTKYSTV